MADQTSKIPFVRISDFEPVSPDVISLVPLGLVKKQKIVPLKKRDGKLIVAAASLEGVIKPEGLALVTGYLVEFVTASEGEIDNFISRHYTGGAPASPPQRFLSVPPELIVSPDIVAPTDVVAPTPEVEPTPAEPSVNPSDLVVEDERHEESSHGYSLILGGPAPDLDKEEETTPVEEEEALDFTAHTSEFESPTAAFLELSSASNVPIPETPRTERTNGRADSIESSAKVLASRDLSIAPEFLSLITEGIINRASEVLLTARGERFELRQRIRGILTPVAGEKGRLSPLLVEKLFAWVIAVGEKQNAESLEWFDLRKEISVAKEDYACHAFLTVAKNSRTLSVRINSQKEALYSPATWGMDANQIKIFTGLLEQKQGFLLFVGAENEGIVSNLNACARYLATPKRHVVAVEPYLESWMAEIDQFSSKGDPVLFNQFLDIAFKHSPDVVVVNPLKNKEHIEKCLSEALKGSLVLGRTYAIDATDALIQLFGMGVEPYLIASSLSGILAKRTIRLNCPVCQEKDLTAKSQAREVGIPEAMQPSNFYVSKGCDSCGQTGFIGETDIFEILVMTPDFQRNFRREMNSDSIRSAIKSSGLLTLRQIAIHRAINGQTSLAEVIRATPR